MRTVLFIISVFFVLPSITWAQNAADYLPAKIGSTWRYQRFTLDSMQNQIASSKAIETDSLAGTTLRGVVNALLFRNRTNALRDSMIVDVHGDTAAFFNGAYPKEGIKLVSDSLGLGFLPQVKGWYAYIKLKSPPLENRADTLFRHDSTITIDGSEFDLTLLITRTRKPAGQVTVPAGTFNTAVPFEIGLTLNWWIFTPLGRRANPFLKLTTVYYVAPGNWIVKETQGSTYFPLTATDNDSIPKFSIPGYVRMLEKLTPTSVPPSDDGAAGTIAPIGFRITQNFPNPFNGMTTLEYEADRGMDVSVGIFDVLGRCVWKRTEGYRTAGVHQLKWDSGTLPSGVYYCRVSAGGVIQMKKMILEK